MSLFKCEECDEDLKFQQYNYYEFPTSECSNCHQQYILYIRMVGDSNEMIIEPRKVWYPVDIGA